MNTSRVIETPVLLGIKQSKLVSLMVTLWEIPMATQRVARKFRCENRRSIIGERKIYHTPSIIALYRDDSMHKIRALQYVIVDTHLMPPSSSVYACWWLLS